MAPIERTFAETCSALGLAGCSVLVAASGGVDSTVLLDLLAGMKRDAPKTLVVGHVHHGLRGAAADADADHVRALAAARGLAVQVRHVDPAALREGGTSQSRPTLQEAARRLRYDALDAIATETGCDCIATAHHLDDQAETVVLRLLRGAGPESLGGIPEQSPDGRIVRPLLAVSREEIEHVARERGLSWREDASNSDRAYARGLLREAGWTRIAAELNPNWLRAVADLAEVQRRDTAWIETIIEAEAAVRFSRPGGEGASLRIAPEGWSTMAEGLARRLARHALREVGAGRDVTRTHVLRMVGALRTARPGSGIELPGGRTLRRDGEAFWLEGPTDASGKPRTNC